MPVILLFYYFHECLSNKNFQEEVIKALTQEILEQSAYIGIFFLNFRYYLFFYTDIILSLFLVILDFFTYIHKARHIIQNMRNL